MRGWGRIIFVALAGVLVFAGSVFWLRSRAPFPGGVIEVEVKGVMVDPVTGSPVVFLIESSGKKFLPIFIGEAEARAIFSELKGVVALRPMTHDLTLSLLRHLGGEMKSVLVSELKGDTFIAQIRVERGRDMLYLDSRPSDAIALALRAGAPVYVSEELFREKSIVIGSSDYPEMIPGDMSELLGLRLQVITPELARHFFVEPGEGLLVSWVDPEGTAQREGIQQGDILLGAEGEKLTSTSDLMKIMQSSKGEFTLEISRGKRTFQKRLRWKHD